MGRQTRREQKILKGKKFAWNDVSDYVSSSESMIGGLSGGDISEIARFIMFMENDLKNVKDAKIIHYVWSQESIQQFTNSGNGLTPYSNLSCLVSRFYWKVIATLLSSNSNSMDTADIGMYLTALSTEAMKKEFKSMLAYVKFLNITLYAENGVYRIVSENKRNQVKRWVNIQHNFQARWGMYMQMPSQELNVDHTLDIPSSWNIT